MCERASLEFLHEFNDLQRDDPRRLARLIDAMSVCANHAKMHRVAFAETTPHQVHRGSAMDRCDFVHWLTNNRYELRATAEANLSWPAYARYYAHRFMDGVWLVVSWQLK